MPTGAQFNEVSLPPSISRKVVASLDGASQAWRTIGGAFRRPVVAGELAHHERALRPYRTTVTDSQRSSSLFRQGIRKPPPCRSSYPRHLRPGLPAMTSIPQQNGRTRQSARARIRAAIRLARMVWVSGLEMRAECRCVCHARLGETARYVVTPGGARQTARNTVRSVCSAPGRAAPVAQEPLRPTPSVRHRHRFSRRCDRPEPSPTPTHPSAGRSATR